MTGVPEMRANGERSQFRRILVALDSTSENLDTVKSVVGLASRLEADLRGVFVEDTDLLRLAGPPKSDRSGTAGAQEAADMIERALRVQAGISREALEKEADRRQVNMSFEVRRGRIAAEVLAAGEEADLLIMDWSSGGFAVRAAGYRGRPGSIARTVAEGAMGSVLLLKPGFNAGGPVLVPYDDSLAARDALSTAALVLERDETEVDVVLLSRQSDITDRWTERAKNMLATHGRTARFARLPATVAGPGIRTGVDQLCMMARARCARLTVVGSDLPLLRGAAERRLLEKIDTSVFLVR